MASNNVPLVLIWNDNLISIININDPLYNIQEILVTS